MTESTRRVTELEIKLPRKEDLKLPKVNMEPVRSVATDLLLTGLGVGVLLARGVAAAVRAAHEAGAEEAKHPSRVTRALMDAVGAGQRTEVHEVRMQVPVLPIDNYQDLTAAEILVRVADLSHGQLQVVREYEATHLNRMEILEAIDRRLQML